MIVNTTTTTTRTRERAFAMEIPSSFCSDRVPDHPPPSIPPQPRPSKKKRRSRAHVRSPIQVFTADVSDFMAMVHKLTGITSHPPPIPYLKPLPFIQGLPTLDTSSAFFSRWSHDRNISTMQGGFNGTSGLFSQQCLDFSELDQSGRSYLNVANSRPYLWEAADKRQALSEEDRPFGRGYSVKGSFFPSSKDGLNPFVYSELSGLENIFDGLTDRHQ